MKFYNNPYLSNIENEKINYFFSNNNVQDKIAEFEKIRLIKFKKFILIFWLSFIVSLILILQDVSSNMDIMEYISMIIVFIICYILSTIVIWLMVIALSTFFDKNDNWISIKNTLLKSLLQLIYWDKLKFEKNGELFNEDLYPITDIHIKPGSMFNIWLIKNYAFISSIEDSMQYTYNLDKNNSIILNWAEIYTWDYVYDKNWNRNKAIVEHFYIFKLDLLNPRFDIKTPLMIFFDSKNNILWNTLKKLRSLFLVIFISISAFIILKLLLNFWSDDNNMYSFISLSIWIFILIISYKDLYWVNLFKKNEMDNANFEKKFNVYCDDEILTRQILTPNIMNNIIDFQNLTKKKYKILFKWNSIYITYNISIFWNYLDFWLYSPLNKSTKIYSDYIFEINTIIDFANKINLLYLDKDYFNRSSDKL